ncbi:MAG: alpha/beta hydrolase [Pseudomonadota bacterium]
MILEARLRRAGFETINESYPSRAKNFEELAATVPAAFAARAGDGPVHFVTHSLGGVLVRAWLAEAPRPGLGRIVMLGPPNRGSALVDRLRDLPGAEIALGPAGLALGEEGAPACIDDAPGRAEIGVIAGDLSLNPVFSALIEGPNDGKVAVEATKFAGMTDHVVLPVSHSFMMNSPAVARLTIRFLREGRFG